MDDYSICIRHYNQIVATDTLLKKLWAGDNSISSSFKESQWKKPKLILDNNTTQSRVRRNKRMFNHPQFKGWSIIDFATSERSLQW